MRCFLCLYQERLCSLGRNFQSRNFIVYATFEPCIVYVYYVYHRLPACQLLLEIMSERDIFNTNFDVRTSFVSLVDHLPAEIIRKLWLIQTLDIQYNAVSDELNAALIRFRETELTKEESNSLVHKITTMASKLNRTRQESLAEARSISASIKLARLRLENQHSQLRHDHKVYLNEIEMQNNLASHAQRSNKRTSTSRPKIKLNLKLKGSSAASSRQSSPARSNSIMKKSAPRKANIIKPYSASPAPASKARKNKKPTQINSVVVRKQETIEDQDQDHTLYCLCNRESAGDMVACDNLKCPKEWFHYGCVGLVRAPRGKWFCPLCEKK